MEVGMNKFKATIECFYLALVFIVVGIWQIHFNNKRVDYGLILKPIPKNKKQKAVSYLEKLYRK